MSTGQLNPSGSSIDSRLRRNIGILARQLVDGFRYHPYFLMLRYSMYSEDPIYPFAHQVELLSKLVARRPLRALIADEIGLGKTITAIMILNYLMEVGEVHRVLVLVPRVLLEQWRSELERVTSARIRVIERSSIEEYWRNRFPPGIYLASIDLVKKTDYRKKIMDSDWEMVIVDEAHRVGRIGGRETLRYELVKNLASRPNVHFLMLTATPHRGRAEDYIERVMLIDPFIDKKPSELDNSYFYEVVLDSIVFRRTKMDVNEIYEKRRVFTDCKFKARLARATDQERDFNRKLLDFLRRKLMTYYEVAGEDPRPLPLLLTIIAKRASSSPEAAIKTLARIIQKRAEELRRRHTLDQSLGDQRSLEEEAMILADALLGYSIEDAGLYGDEYGVDVGRETDDIIERFVEKAGLLLDDADVKELEEISELARSIRDGVDSRLESLVKIIENHLSKGEKIVVFTEFKDTAEYIYARLRAKLPKNIADRIALVTSDKIMPPRSIPYRSNYTIEDVKSWLRRGYVDVIVSTDVSSEGLNLQVASVVVHYEPTWSPVKIVQRIGRVWRLGQERDVTSYSLLLDTESDIAVLKILYGKLLSWIITGVSRDIVIGEELEIDMYSGTSPTQQPVDIPVSGEKGRPRFSEYRAILEFIRGGDDALARYVEKLIESLKEVRREAERIWPKHIRRDRVEKILEESLAGVHGQKGEEILRKLLISISKSLGIKVETRADRVTIDSLNLINLKEARDFYIGLVKLLESYDGEPPIILLARKPDSDTLRGVREVFLYNVDVRLEDKPVYSEVVGVARGERMRILRGFELLESLSSILENVIDVADEYQGAGYDYSDFAKTGLRDRINHIIRDYISYVEKSEKSDKRFSNNHSSWLPRSIEDFKTTCRLIGVLILNGSEDSGRRPLNVEDVERKAMEVVMRYEQQQGRIPEDVSDREHYDIRSYDPRTGEIRYIEVKGRWPLDLTVELTEAEYRFGEEHRDSYWLYIVYGFETGTPSLLALRDPIGRGIWKEVEIVKREKRYRLAKI